MSLHGPYIRNASDEKQSVKTEEMTKLEAALLGVKPPVPVGPKAGGVPGNGVKPPVPFVVGVVPVGGVVEGGDPAELLIHTHTHQTFSKSCL